MGSYGKTRPHGIKKKDAEPVKTDEKKNPE